MLVVLPLAGVYLLYQFITVGFNWYDLAWFLITVAACGAAFALARPRR